VTTPAPTERTAGADLNRNPLHLIEANVVAPAIVELGGAGRGMVRHGRGVFEGAAVFEIRGDSGRPKSVVADLGFDAGGPGAADDHRIGVGLGQGRGGELLRGHRG
jgi:hypothetical protein